MTLRDFIVLQELRLAGRPSSRKALHAQARTAYEDRQIHGPETLRVGGVGFHQLVAIARGADRTRHDSDCLNADFVLDMERFIARVRSVPDIYERPIVVDISSARLI